MDVRSVIAENFIGKPVSTKVYKTTEAVTPAVHWDVWECLREFVQNAMDEMTPEVTKDGDEARKPIVGNDFGIEYDGDTWIWDRGRGVLVEEVLITGLSGKRTEMKVKRGEFGEGIKKSVATLLSMGYEVEIYTRRGKFIKPRVGLFTVEGRPVKIVEYVVKAYDNVKMDLGTVVRVKRTVRYRPEDFIITGNVLASVRDYVFLVTPECYERLPEDIKVRMRGNEIPASSLWDAESHCKDVKPFVSVKVWNQIVDRENVVAYRDLLLKKDIKSFFGYNIWSHVPVSVMGRDRTIISNSWLNSTIGNLYRSITGDKEFREIADPKIFQLLPQLLNVYDTFGKGAEIEFDMEYWGTMFEDEINFLKPFFTKVFGEKFATHPTGAYPEILEVLKYHGYRLVAVPENLSRLISINNWKAIYNKLKEEKKLYKLVPDDKLEDKERIILSFLRKFVERIYRERMDDLKKVYEEHGLVYMEFINEPPKIYAYDYSEADRIEKNIITYGHTDYDRKIIGISVKALKSFIESIAVLNHELTHYVTRLGDEDPRAFIKALERVAGVIESMLIEEANFMLGM